MDLCGSPQLVHELDPRVAIMNNGARKGGAAETWQTIPSLTFALRGLRVV
jgi:hypothetical protein